MGWSGRALWRCQFEGGKGGIIQYLGEECLYNMNSQRRMYQEFVCPMCLKISRENGEAEAQQTGRSLEVRSQR